MKKHIKLISYAVASVLAIASVFCAIIAFSPAAAVAYAPDLPVVKELIRLNEENSILKDKLELNSEILEEYKHTITEEDRNEVGNIVLEFVAAQYSGNKDKMYSLCSEEFREILKRDPLLAQAYGKDVELKIVIVSNIVKEADKYIAFIRIEDSRAESQYQENFYLSKTGDKFFITMIEQDI